MVLDREYPRLHVKEATVPTEYPPLDARGLLNDISAFATLIFPQFTAIKLMESFCLNDISVKLNVMRTKMLNVSSMNPNANSRPL